MNINELARNIKNMNKEEIVEELERINVKVEDDEAEIDWDNHCYNPDVNGCSRTCDGLSACPILKAMETDADWPSREEVKDYFTDIKISALYAKSYLKKSKIEIGYTKREYCRDIDCIVQKEIDKEETNTELIKNSACRSYCRAYDFHKWLEENNYKIVRR